MDDGEVIERAYVALATGDLIAARACFTPDAKVWHGFDGIVRDLDETMSDWEGIVANFAERGIDDVRRERIDDGFLQ